MTGAQVALVTAASLAGAVLVACAASEPPPALADDPDWRSR